MRPPGTSRAAVRPGRGERARVAVILPHGVDARRWRRRHERGETGDVTPYGYELAGSHYEMAWSTDRCEAPVWRVARRRAMSALGFDLVHVWRNRAVMDRSDVIWTHTEREHLAVTLAYVVRPWRRWPAVLAQTVWLWDDWPSASPTRRRLTAFLLRRQPVEAVHSHVNAEIARREVPGRQVLHLPFGTAPCAPGTDTGIDGAAAPPPVLTVGNDRHRDWVLLDEVAHALPDVEFRVMSTSRGARALRWPANVEVRPAASRQELEEAYRSCAALVLPLLPNVHASGATTVIEGMSAQCRVVVTDVGGIGDYVAPEVLLVPPADAAALTDAVRAAVDGRVTPVSAGAVSRLGLTQADYVARYVLVTEWLLGRRELDPDPSDFAPRHSAVTLSERADEPTGGSADQSRSR